jgi:hypothetical protein
MGLSLVAMCVLGCGCAFTAHHLDPRPAVRATRSPHALEVQVDAAVPDALYLDEDLGAPALDVKGWRTALETGLKRARDGAFSTTPAEGGAWRVVVTEAKPRLVAQELDDGGKALLLTAEVAWKALLFDPLMQPVAQGEGQALVPGSFRGMSDASPLLSQGIEIVVVDVLRFVDTELARVAGVVEPTPEK